MLGPRPLYVRPVASSEHRRLVAGRETGRCWLVVRPWKSLHCFLVLLWPEQASESPVPSPHVASFGSSCALGALAVGAGPGPELGRGLECLEGLDDFYLFSPAYLHFSPLATHAWIRSNAWNIYHTYQCLQIQVSTYKYILIQTHTAGDNTYQYVQYISLLTNTYKYRLGHTIHTNAYHKSNTGQYRAIHANTYVYIPMRTIHTIFSYMPILTNTYQYLHLWPVNTYQ